MRAAAQCAVAWILLFAAWLAFAASVKTAECLVGVAAAGATAVAFEISRRVQPLRFRPPATAVAQAWRLPWLVVKGTWVLLAELARRIQHRHPRSVLRLTTFTVRGTDGGSAGKRALAILYGSLPPNSLIIDVDRKAGRLLFHQVRKEPLPEIVRRVESA